MCSFAGLASTGHDQPIVKIRLKDAPGHCSQKRAHVHFRAMINDPLNFEIFEPKSDERIFKLAGALTLTNMFGFQDKFRELPPANTVIDLTEVSYVDSAGIG